MNISFSARTHGLSVGGSVGWASYQLLSIGLVKPNPQPKHSQEVRLGPKLGPKAFCHKHTHTHIHIYIYTYIHTLLAHTLWQL